VSIGLTLFLVAVSIVALAVAAGVYARTLQWKRADFIRTARLPKGLLHKLAEKYPRLTRKETALVSRGLRQFFVAYLMSGKKYVSMPSQVVDELWHEFILYTREYQGFCRRAFGGFMHHAPAAALSENRQSNAGLRRVWWYACKYEQIDPRKPTRLPLLFALDSKLKIPGGFSYHHDCETLQRRDAKGGVLYCGGDFSSSTVDGSMEGFGGADSSSASSSDGGDGGGGGCGGGE
jgi:hypothetical protein